MLRSSDSHQSRASNLPDRSSELQIAVEVWAMPNPDITLT
jgi:hypothetical protein